MARARRGERRGQAVEKKPTGEAERAADRVAGREPLDAGSGRPIDPDKGRLERPDLNDRSREGGNR
jgi:hypothetical protein